MALTVKPLFLEEAITPYVVQEPDLLDKMAARLSRMPVSTAS